VRLARAIVLLGVSAALIAQQVDPTELLVHAAQLLADRAKRLPDYTCVQTVDRLYFKRRRHTYVPRSCDQILSLDPHTLAVESTDRLRLDLKVSQGLEVGSWVGLPFTQRNIFEMVGGGPYGTGMLGAFISDIFSAGGATYTYAGLEKQSDRTVAVFRFQVPASASHYQVKAGANWVATAYSGSFWLDPKTAELHRLEVQTHDLPPETDACEAVTTVDYEKSRVGTGEFLLPSRSSLLMVMQDESETESTAVYAGCHEYHGESTIHFDQVPGSVAPAKDASPAAPLPPGLTFTLAFTAPIDTDTAAAGDVIAAKLRHPIRDPKSKAALAPAGAHVTGRIVQLQHWLSEPWRFKVSIMLESVEFGGQSRPLYAKIVRIPSMLESIAVPPPGQPAWVAAFLFPTEKKRYRVPAGYESTWITIEAPDKRP